MFWMSSIIMKRETMMRRMMTTMITRWRRSKRMRMRMASELSLESVPGYDIGDREWYFQS